jgi:hypothetical protein
MGEGERQEAQRHRTLLTSFYVLLAFMMLVGFFVGLTAARRGIPVEDFWASLPRPLTVGILALLLAIYVYGTWRFMKTFDEFELANNLWGSSASYYIYATLFPMWWALAKIDVVPEPNDWAIFFVAVGGGALVHLWRIRRAR